MYHQCWWMDIKQENTCRYFKFVKYANKFCKCTIRNLSQAQHYLNFCYKNRSSHQSCFVRKDILRNFAKFTGKHLWQSLFLNKVAGLRPTSLLKKSLWHRCFSANFAKFLRTPFLQNTFGDCFRKNV